MDKKIKYSSIDKLYFIKKKYLKKEIKQIIIVLILSLLCLLSFLLYRNSIDTDRENSNIKYQEQGQIDYKVYLKDNNYYEESYLGKDMQYIASLIKTINIDYIYDLTTDEELDYKYSYTIKTNLKITEQNNKNKVLYTKEEILLKDDSEEKENKDIHIEEDIDIDYDKYNNHVNSFKKDYGLTVSSDLEIILQVNLKANNKKSEEVLNNNRQLKVIVPLSEQTIDILIDTEEIKNEGTIELNQGNSQMTNVYLISTILLVLSTIIFILYMLHSRNNKDIYTAKVNKILREYDRLIVEGKINIDEKAYKNKIYPDKFEELVDVSQLLNVPILYYNVVPNHKCYFVVVTNDTMYKYRITRGYQNKKEEGKKENETT